MAKSLFLITIGAAGSGKGFIMQNLMNFIASQYSDVKDTTNLNYARIDDYIELDENFIKESLNIVIKGILPDQDLTNYVKTLKNMNNTSNEINNYLTTNQLSNNLSKLENLADSFSKIYFQTRKKYDKINDLNLNKWINARENIVFETTGQSKFDWIFEHTPLNDPDVLKDYIVIVVYPYVSKDIILSRALNRFIVRVNDAIDLGNIMETTTPENQNFIQYVNNIKHGNKINNIKPEAPRLPKLITGEYPLLNSIPAIQDNIADYIINCAQTQDNVITSIILYDNMTYTPIISVNLGCKKVIKFTEECTNTASFQKKYSTSLTPKLLNAINLINTLCNEQHNNTNILLGGNEDMYYRKYMKYKNKYNKKRHNK